MESNECVSFMPCRRRMRILSLRLSLIFMLAAIADIHACGDKLNIATPTAEERTAEQIAQEIDTESTERASNFSFSKCHIPIGEKIEYYENPNITATVVDDRNVEYNGDTMSLTALAKLLSRKTYSIAGPKFFKYEEV